MPETTEAQVVELEDGRLMLNMRNNVRTGRMVYTTDDMGQSWKEHPSSGKLIEPVCMASLIKTSDGILLFSNPATDKSRFNMTVKASLDSGESWDEENSLLLDEENGWGYSCMSMIDENTVGILYESSTGQMLFQAVKLSDIIKNR